MNSRIFRKNMLVSSILLSCFGLPNIYAANNENDIYKLPNKGKTTLLMMLDTSSGMDEAPTGSKPQRSIKNDYPTNSCTTGSDVIKQVDKDTLNSWYNASSFIYGMPYCLINSKKSLSSDNVAYSRMDRMKVAMTLLFGSKANTSDDIVMGLGQFSTQTNQKYYGTTTTNSFDYDSLFSLVDAKNQAQTPASISGNDVSAKIVVPAAALDQTQRDKISNVVAALGSGGKAPLASALAESAGYMLGTSTLDNDGNAPTVLSGSKDVSPFWYAKGGGFCFSFDKKTWYNYDSGYGQWFQRSSSSCSSTSYYNYSYSGFNDSVQAAKELDTNPNRANQYRYKTPVQSDTQQCNANGIFLVTNSAPTETPKPVAQTLMQNVIPGFTCPSSGDANGIQAVINSSGNDYGWTCMAAFAQELNKRNIKVAVAGYGNNFSAYIDKASNGKYDCNNASVNQDTKNACYLGNFGSGYGEGGFYPIVSPESLTTAVQGFISTLDTSIPSTGAATPTVPYDTLNNTQQLSSVYYAQFQPDIRNSQKVGIWLGNIKKYWIDSDGTYKDKNSNSLVDSSGNFASTQDYWNTSGSNDGANVQKGGALSQLPVKQRSIYRESTLNNKVTQLTATSLQATANDTSKTRAERLTSKYLLNLMGYSISVETTDSQTVASVTDTQLSQSTALRQIGASLHSSPVFFTTEAKLCSTATSNTACVNSTTQQKNNYYDRKDFILFGTMQGLIQVVNANTGVEAFSFLPDAIVNSQQNGFLAKSLQTGSGYTTLYQGMDAPWSVYTNYTSNSVDQSIKASTLNVYGGMRRGGNNYYGLDLATNNDSGFTPKRLFTIAPSGTCSTSNPLGCMGQSWSKPAIGWIKWKGKPQLVMIVGGGYDPQFDDKDYKVSTATKGNGVYIFAAKDSDTDSTVKAGNLLWWASSSATDVTTGTNMPYAKNNTDLKYSVVSEIKTVDRDSDGFIDNLYFGDLGGQIFRIDINNSSSSTTNSMVASHVTRIANFAVSGSVAPKFYNMPTFTVHSKGALTGVSDNANYYGVLSIGSGDVSSPSLFATQGITDKIYGLFDRDVGRSDLYTSDNLQAVITLSNLKKLADSDTQSNNFFTAVKQSSGWYDELTGSGYSSSSSDTTSLVTNQTRYKVLNGSSALKNTLFMSYYDAADSGSSGACQAGIKGRTYLKTYCLPFGKMNASGSSICSTNGAGSSTGRTYSAGAGVDLGSGMQPLVVNGYQSNGSNTIGPITSNSSSQAAQYSTSLKFVSKTWYEE